MLLSTHFSLAEMTTTGTGLANNPGAPQIRELQRLCVDVLEPWRALVGRIHINSGYRSPEVNRAVKGSATSDHVHGRAADCAPVDVDLETAWLRLVDLPDEVPIDQAIYYLRKRGKGWIHVGRRDNPRRELLVQLPDGSYVPWSTYDGPMVLG
jgi:zinc D-Ala-D-Ala carboxypeptidase